MRRSLAGLLGLFMLAGFAAIPAGAGAADTVMFAGIAIVTWLYTQPEMSRMAEFEIGWIAHIFVRNLVLLIVFYGGLHSLALHLQGPGRST